MFRNILRLKKPALNIKITTHRKDFDKTLSFLNGRIENKDIQNSLKEEYIQISNVSKLFVGELCEYFQKTRIRAQITSQRTEEIIPRGTFIYQIYKDRNDQFKVTSNKLIKKKKIHAS